MQAFHCVRQCKSSRADVQKDTGGCQVLLHCIQGIWNSWKWGSLFWDRRASNLTCVTSKELCSPKNQKTGLVDVISSFPFLFAPPPTFSFSLFIFFLPLFPLRKNYSVCCWLTQAFVKPLTIPLRIRAHNSGSSFPLCPPLHVLWLMTWFWDGRKAYFLDSLGRNYLGSVGYSEARGPRGPVNIVQVSLVQRT